MLSYSQPYDERLDDHYNAGHLISPNTSPITNYLEENHAPSPRIEIASLDTSPFSESFSDFLEPDEPEATTSPVRGVCSSRRRVSIYQPHAPTNPDMSYHLEHFTNLEELVSEWADDRIDEIVVMSPKTRLPRIPEEEDIQGPPRNYAKLPKLGSHLTVKTSPIGLSDFELLNTLDSGTSKITLGRKRDSYKLYALKSISTTSSSAFEDARSEEACLMLLNELRCPILSRLQWSFQHENMLYLVMDFYPGGNLAALLTRENVLRPKYARLYANEITEGIAALHAAGIVHRDLQPNNILIDTKGHPVITGFACAAILDTSNSRTINKPLALTIKKDYQAPELLLGWTHDFSVDCWAFGVLLYMMVYGTHPFIDTNEGATTVEQNILRSSLPSYPHNLAVDPAAQRLIAQCLERNPVARLDIQAIRADHYLMMIASHQLTSQRNIPALDGYRTQPEFDHEFDNMNMAWASPFSIESASPLSSDIGPFERLPPTGEPQDLQNNGPLHSKTSSTQSSTEFSTPSADPSLVARTSEPKVEEQEIRPGVPGQSATIEKLENVQNFAEDLRQRQQAARDRFWETLSVDEDLASSSRSMTFLDALDLVPSQSQPHKLCKKRSLMSAHRIFSTISESSTHVPNKLRKKLRPTSTPSLLPRIFPSIDLPNGIEQMGNGIGYTRSIPSPGISVSTPSTRACSHLFSGTLPMLGLGLGIGKSKRAPEVIREAGEVIEVLDITGETYEGPSGLGLGVSGLNMTSPFASGTTATETTNSPASEILATPDAIEFGETREAKTGDPNVTLRLVSSGLQFDAIRRDLGLAPSDLPAIPPFRPSHSRNTHIVSGLQ